MMRLMIALSLMTIGLFTLSGCNTVDGVGKDLESAGKTIQNV